MKSYLGNRRHVVSCSGTRSEEVRVKYGVPQGSVLGPLCFILYVNDLIAYISQNKEAEIIMYADDTVILVENDDPILAINSMQKVLDKAIEWCKQCKLTINVKKTKHMFVLRNKDLVESTSILAVKINNLQLANVSSYKYLGVDIDRNLTYEEVVHNTYLKANKKLFTLRKIRPYVTERVAALIYKQFILPIMDYADFLFESAPKYELDYLDTVQKRAIRIIKFGNGTEIHNEEIERKYSLTKLYMRRRIHHLALMYRLSDIESYIDSTRPNIDLRSRNKIKFRTDVTKLTKVMRSPYYRGMTLWDGLTENVQRATTKVKFKRLLSL